MRTHIDLSHSRLADTYGALDMDRRQPTERELYGDPATTRTAAAAPARRPTLYGNTSPEHVDCGVPPSLAARYRRVRERLRVLRESSSQSTAAMRARDTDALYGMLNRVKEAAAETGAETWSREITALEAELYLE